MHTEACDGMARTEIDIMIENEWFHSTNLTKL